MIAALIRARIIVDALVILMVTGFNHLMVFVITSFTMFMMMIVMLVFMVAMGFLVFVSMATRMIMAHHNVVDGKEDKEGDAGGQRTPRIIMLMLMSVVMIMLRLMLMPMFMSMLAMLVLVSMVMMIMRHQLWYHMHQQRSQHYSTRQRIHVTH